MAQPTKLLCVRRIGRLEDRIYFILLMFRICIVYCCWHCVLGTLFHNSRRWCPQERCRGILCYPWIGILWIAWRRAHESLSWGCFPSLAATSNVEHSVGQVSAFLSVCLSLSLSLSQYHSITCLLGSVDTSIKITFVCCVSFGRSACLIHTSFQPLWVSFCGGCARSKCLRVRAPAFRLLG